VVTPAVETTAPSVDIAERPVDTFAPPVTATTPPGRAVRFEGDDFYAVPEPLPAGEAGTLLRHEPIDLFGGWSNFVESPGEFGLQTLGPISGDVVLWRDPVALRPERVDRPVPDEAVGRSAEELASWLAEHPDLDASDPQPVSVGGLNGFAVEIAIAPHSTNTPVSCPSGEVCVDLFAPPHLEYAWRLVGRGDRARMILLATADNSGTVLIAADPYDHLGTDLEAFDALAKPLLDSIDFAAGEPEPATGECERGVGSCRGPLQPGRYRSADFQPSFRYSVPARTAGGPTAWRMMYLSESIHGEPIAVTGTALVPSIAAPDGGHPILSVAHGTTDIADQCAPSHDPSADLAAYTQYVNAGYLVAATAYEGLGTSGRHPYLVGESEGRGVLDAAKAVRQLPDADAGDQLAIWGHSQGGHAALWAAQLAARWAPELELVGTVAAGVPADLTDTGETVETGPAKGYIFLTIAGYAAAYPDLELSSVLTPAGEAELGIVDEHCAEDVLAHFADNDPAELLQPLGAVKAWTTLLDENNPGQTRVDAPILVVHGTNDFLPIEAVQHLHERMCTFAQQIELRVIDGGDHDASWVVASADGFEWIQQRLAGKQSVSTCPSS
jgi:pimeloyl-ACP methyl ester carboxylesterase